ncbi:MAG TPA: GAF domain-containing protein [Methylomirabilota bacterium]|jgi:two-component system NtrC family sensor kinase|nr:GAF domain-containing protein [Methylomirabilota bacterium]
MKIGQRFPDLLATLGRGASPEQGFARSLRDLLALSGAGSGGLCFTPSRGTPVIVTAGTRRGSALDDWMRARLREPIRGTRLAALKTPPPGWRGAGPVMLSAALGDRSGTLGGLLLLGRRGRGGLSADTIPPSFPREFGLAMAQVWRLHQRTLRLETINEITSLTATTRSLEHVYRTVAAALSRLIRFDALSVTLIDRERHELRFVEVGAGTGELHDRRLAMGGTLAEWVAERRRPRRVDDIEDPAVPPVSAELLSQRGFRSAMVAPLVAQDEVIGTLNVGHREPRAFTEADIEILTEVARPVASAIEHSRLHGEIVRRAEELAALNRTSQLMSARLDLDSVLETISRSATILMGSTGCGIGLLTADRSAIEHVAAHGFKTFEWRALSMPVGTGIIGRAAATGKPIRSDDLQRDPRSAQRDVDEKEGIRSILSVPLRVAGEIIGVISAFSTAPAAFTERHQTLLESFADQAGIAIQNARLFEESQRRARQTQALYEAGRAVNQSLEVGETIRVILNQAREVLGVQSCGLFTLDPASGELVSVASLDLEPAQGRIRIHVGEGITGAAVKERRTMQSSDLHSDPRVRYHQLSAGGGFRSMLAAPLVVGDQAIGALTALRRDVHRFTPEEESLVSAFADQAAMALEHARLFSSVRTYSEQLEAMVAARTRELDEQKRFVEVVLETLPLGLFVLDRGLRVVSANREGVGLLPFHAGERPSFLDLIPPAKAGEIRAFLQTVMAAGAVRQLEEEMPYGTEARIVRLTAAALKGPGGDPTHGLVLVEDITLQKRLERQMLLTERLTTAGRLAAGVAHELNNPLATIAGCAEALKERAQDPRLGEAEAFKDFPSYLSLIEEEAYRCKEITGSLLQFVREPGSRRAPTDVNALVEKALELLSHQSRFAQSRLVADLDPTLPSMIANEGQLRQVFLGLSANALEAMDGHGTLTVRTGQPHPGEVQIAFEDQGPGIAEDILPRVFDPFFTTKPPGQGTGLGLAIAQGIVADHAGRIEVSSHPGAGTTFRVILPLAASSGDTGP